MHIKPSTNGTIYEHLHHPTPSAKKYPLTRSLQTAIDALDNLKSKFKAIFKKKNEKKADTSKPAESKPAETPAESKPAETPAATTTPATEPTKTDAAPPAAPASTFCYPTSLTFSMKRQLTNKSQPSLLLLPPLPLPLPLLSRPRPPSRKPRRTMPRPLPNPLRLPSPVC
ncbi:hypothetical protein LY78DRAFT_652649 [Colletotrichum sublineola]|nr:hypothetical protein LY78DRAFT_652649 [Colletotrichum sublineola]